MSEIQATNKPGKGKQIEIKETAKKNFLDWVETLGTKDPKIVAQLYSEDATFLPTVSPDFKKGQAGVEDYFEHFLQKNPKELIVDEEIQPLSPDTYLDSGMYNFEVDSPQGAGRQTVEARFSFIWKKQGDAWKILHHHSSIRPK